MIPFLQQGPPDWLPGPPPWTPPSQPCWPPGPCVPIGDYLPLALIITGIIIVLIANKKLNK